MGCHLMRGFNACAVLLVLVLLMMVSVGCVDSCISGPEDSVAIEVVLNKPGVVYDLGKLDGVEDVVKVNDYTYVYRSHVDTGILVIVYVDSLLDLREKYLAVRVQPQIVYENTTLTRYSAYLYFENLSIDPSRIYNVSNNLGWILDYYNPRSGTIYANGVEGTVFDGRVERVVDNATVWIDFRGVSVNDIVSMELSITVEGDITSVVNETIYSFIREYVGREPEIKYSGGLITITEKKPSVEKTRIVGAIAYELEWLTGIGVINGLSWSDLEMIRKSAEPGYAGVNSRLVYANNRWEPFSKAFGVQFLGGCRNIDMLLRNISIPNNPPYAPITNSLVKDMEVDTNRQVLLISISIALLSTIIVWLLMKIKVI